MVKHRLIPMLLFKDGWLVRSKQFQFFQKLGDPHIQFNRLISWDVDELIYLDISANPHMRSYGPRGGRLLDHLESLSSANFGPMAVGGGISSLKQAENMLRNGADRLIINTEAHKNPDFVTSCAKSFGSQAIVVSIDFKTLENNKKMVFTECGQNATEMSVLDCAKQAENSGAGEILINSIDKNGTCSGYDVDVIRSVTDAVGISVTAAGGAGQTHDFISGIIDGGASAVAGGSIYNFSELSYLNIKSELLNAGLNFRQSKLDHVPSLDQKH